MSTPYPAWSFFPRNSAAPQWAAKVVAGVEEQRGVISTLDSKGLASDAVLAAIGPALVRLGFKVETSKSRAAKLRRPVLYGLNGREALAYEIDAFHDELGIAVEVEAGRGVMNNADYRDLIRAALILNAQFLVLLMPLRYRYAGSPVEGVLGFGRTQDMLDAIYASQRLRLPFDGILLVGY